MLPKWNQPGGDKAIKKEKTAVNTGVLVNLEPLPVEAVFNQHPEVVRAALVGVKKVKLADKIPVICIERVENKKRKIYLYEKLS